MKVPAVPCEIISLTTPEYQWLSGMQTLVVDCIKDVVQVDKVFLCFFRVIYYRDTSGIVFLQPFICRPYTHFLGYAFWLPIQLSVIICLSSLASIRTIQLVFPRKSRRLTLRKGSRNKHYFVLICMFIIHICFQYNLPGMRGS